MTGRRILLCGALLVSGSGVAAQRASIVVQVRSSVDNAPLSAARITLTLPDGRDSGAVTDSTGRHTFHRLSAGSYTLRATWRELVSHPAVIRLGRREEVEVEFNVGPRPEPAARLPELSVAAPRITRSWMRQFDERRGLGVGQFLTREDLAPRASASLPDVLRTVRGIRLHCSGGVCIPQMIRARAGCYPRFIMDESDVDAQIFARTVVGDVEGIEIYEGQSQVPLEFRGDARRNYCGVIVVWTRRPGLTDPPASPPPSSGG